MDGFFKFAGEHPILTFLLAVITMWTVVGVFEAISGKHHHHHYKDRDK